MGAYGEPDPLRPIARIAPETESSGPAFPLARSERELWVASGRSGRYLLDPEGGKLSASWTLAGAGPALGPPQIAGPYLTYPPDTLMTAAFLFAARRFPPKRPS